MKKVLRRTRVVSFLLWVGVFTSLAFAQLPTATILGVVKDSSGAVVPGATLTARNVETGQTRTAVSAADGSYRFSALPVGSYEVRVEQSGFQAAVRSGLTLTVGQEAVINFSLEVGAVTQTIAVTGEAPLVNTTSGSLGGLVDEDRVADLPLNGRNYIDLTMLQTGVTQASGPRVQFIRYGGWFSSSGAPLLSNNYLLDGAPMISVYGGTPAAITCNSLGVEGIREYRVVTNSFSAEYGLTMGSQMVIVSKGGTNSFHGSVFEYLRNSALDARNFFDYKTEVNPRRLPNFVRNNFGAALGGPIVSDRTFFHMAYEGLRERLGLSRIVDAIGAGCRGPAGATITNRDCPQLGSTPSVTISPVMAPFLPHFNLPNQPNNQYIYPHSQPTGGNWGQVRADQTISDDDSLFGRYTINEGAQTQPLNYAEFTRIRSSKDQFATVSESHIFSPSLLNTFRVSFSRITQKNEAGGQKLLGEEFWFVRGVPDFAAGLPIITIGGLTGWGPQTPAPNPYVKDTWTFSDDLFYTRGRHALKFGTLINRYKYQLEDNARLRGEARFPNLAGFLEGRLSNIVVVVPERSMQRNYRHTIFGFYAQDDIRVRDNLTLNLGLRYEFSTEFQEKNGLATPIVDILKDDSITTGKTVFKNPTLRNFSPRFGFAWDVRGDGRTAIRGGFGLLYDVGNLAANLLRGIPNPPFTKQSSVPNPPPLTALPFAVPPGVAGKSLRGMDYNIQQPHMLQYNLTVERQLPGEMALTVAYVGSRGLNLMQTTEGNPTVPQILPDGRKFWTGSEPRINPNWNDYEMYTGSASSRYNSLQIGLRKRLSQGLQFQSSYTWSRVIDEPQGSGVGGEGAPMDPSNPKLDRGVALFDVAHNWRVNAIYRLPDLIPAGGVAGTLLNGWGMSGILSLRTGYPVNPGLSSNRSRSNLLGGASIKDRPDLAPGVKVADITQGVSRGCGTGGGSIPAGTPLGDRWRWFDPCAFTLGPVGFLGNAGRNILRGPGMANVDFSLLKDFPMRFLGESGRLEFRAEVFNVLNRVNFSDPSAGVYAGRAAAENPLGTAGRITSTVHDSRQLQFALKLIF